MATNRSSFSYQVDGLRELVRDLKTEPERLDKELRKRFKEVAEDVRDEARSRAAGRSSPRPGSRVVNTIRASSGSADARVSIGSPSVPWAMGHEFGSLRYRQFPSWRGSAADAGWFFWPAIREAKEEDIPNAIDAIITEFARRAFPD